MDMSILQLLSQLLGNNASTQNSSQTQAPPAANNPSASSYPPEAFFHPQESNADNAQKSGNPFASLLSGMTGSGNQNNVMGLLSSLLAKGENPLTNILQGQNKKEEDSSSSPKNEILL